MKRCNCPTAGVTGRWAGLDSAREQYKLEARKMLENGDDSHLPVLGDLPRVQCTRCWVASLLTLVLDPIHLVSFIKRDTKIKLRDIN
jgi:hypothetical protein